MNTTAQNELSADVLGAMPQLRRYAFCLTGSRKTGDYLVELCVLELARDVDAASESSITHRLFKIFHAHPEIRKNLESPFNAPASVCVGVHRAVLELPLEARQAVLMVKTMGFAVDQAAAMMGLPPERVQELVETAVKLLAPLQLVREPAAETEKAIEPAGAEPALAAAFSKV